MAEQGVFTEDGFRDTLDIPVGGVSVPDVLVAPIPSIASERPAPSEEIQVAIIFETLDQFNTVVMKPPTLEEMITICMQIMIKTTSHLAIGFAVKTFIKYLEMKRKEVKPEGHKGPW